MNDEPLHGDGMQRREFLQSCSLFTAGALLAGALPLAALDVRATTGRRVGDRISYPVPATDGVEVDRENSVLLARYQHHLYAFSMICPHQRAAVKWLEHEQIFQCSKHKSRYGPEGDYRSGRATRGLDRHPLQVAANQVVVDAGVILKEDEDAAAWAAAVAQV